MIHDNHYTLFNTASGYLFLMAKERNNYALASEIYQYLRKSHHCYLYAYKIMILLSVKSKEHQQDVWTIFKDIGKDGIAYNNSLYGLCLRALYLTNDVKHIPV